MRRIASSLVIASLLLGLFVFAFSLQPAKAQSGGTIYIDPDGTINSPVPANITNSGNVTYAFTGNNYLPIIVNRSNIIINGMGYALQVPGQLAFKLIKMSHVTIKNTTITNSGYGVELTSCFNCNVTGNNITNNSVVIRHSENGYGIDLYSSSCTVSGNNITNSPYGLYLSSSSCNVSGNNIKNNSYGIFLFSSSCGISGNNITNNSYDDVGIGYSTNCTVSGNNITNSPYGIEVDSSNCTVSGNKVTSNGYAVEILNSANNNVLENSITNNNYYGVYLSRSSNNTISGNNITGNSSSDGIWLVSSFNNSITKNNITINLLGINLLDSSNNKISENHISGNAVGISESTGSSNNTISGNNITGNTDDGILSGGSVDILSHNNIANNRYGVWLNSVGSTISGNNVTANGYGIALYSSSGNVLSGNNITTSTTCGAYLNSSSGNRIFHNNFLYNTQQASTNNSTNTWDDGYPSGGNYWSDYRTTYPNAVENDSSAIWNMPYVIDSNNTDRYPLVGPFNTFYVDAFTCYVDIISNSTISNFHWLLLLEKPERILFFNVSGTSGTVGFCRVDIPAAFTWQSGSWSLAVGSTPYTNETIITYGNYTYIYFTYRPSTQPVSIINTNSVPEFQPYMLLPLFMIITLLAAMILKKKRN